MPTPRPNSPAPRTGHGVTRTAAPVPVVPPQRRAVTTAYERLVEAAGTEPGATGPGGPRFGRVRLRNAFSLTSRNGPDGREYHLVTAPKRGPERRRARDAVLEVLARAEQQRQRVCLLVTLGDYSQLRIGPRTGYEARAALRECRDQGEDPFEWCAREHLRYRAELVRADAIIGIELQTWRPASSAPPTAD